METQAVTAVANAITFVVPLIMLIVSLFTFASASKERHTKSAAEQAEIGIKLDNNLKALEEIKGTIKDLTDGFNDHGKAITQLDTRVNGLEGRIKKLEIALKTLEDKVHAYHTRGHNVAN